MKCRRVTASAAIGDVLAARYVPVQAQDDQTRADISHVSGGGPHGIRTHDLGIANAALSQLS